MASREHDIQTGRQTNRDVIKAVEGIARVRYKKIDHQTDRDILWQMDKTKGPEQCLRCVK